MKGYRLFDPDRSKVFYSRDVKFNELEFGLKECRDIEPVGYFEVVNDGGVLEEIGAEETMPDQVVTETEPRRFRESDTDLTTMQKEYLLSLIC